MIFLSCLAIVIASGHLKLMKEEVNCLLELGALRKVNESEQTASSVENNDRRLPVGHNVS